MKPALILAAGTSALLGVLAVNGWRTAARSSGVGPDDRVAGWRSDLDALVAQVARQHYVYREQPLPEEFRAAADRLRVAIPALSDERVLVELQGIMARLGDGHSYVLPMGARRVTSHVVPLRFHLFSDGLFVIDAEPGYESRIGSRVVRVNGAAIEQVLERLDTYVSRDNPMGARWIGPVLLRFRGTLEAVAPGSDPERIAITLESRRGVSDAIFRPIPAPPMRGLPKLVPSRLPAAPPAPLYLRNVAAPFWFERLPNVDAVYVQFNQVVDADGESLASFAERLGRHLASRLPSALIVDVRHNNGGHAELAEPLLRTLQAHDARAGARLFVLTGRNTFSAAQIFIARLDASTRAVFAGEPSSSRPNFVGEENAFVLPWSGAMASISNRYHEQIPGDRRPWIEPEIQVALSSGDYFANRDPVLDAVIDALRRGLRCNC